MHISSHSFPLITFWKWIDSRQPRGFKVFGGKRWSMAVDDIHGRMDGRFLDDERDTTPNQPRPPRKFAGAPKMG